MIRVIVTAAVIVFFGCGRQIQSTTQAATSNSPRAPVIATDFSYTFVGPIGVSYFLDGSDHNVQTLGIHYDGILRQRGACPYRSVHVGLVQEGRLIGVTNLSSVGRSGIECAGNIVIDESVQDGEIEFYAYDDSGNYDSDYGKNFKFTFKRD